MLSAVHRGRPSTSPYVEPCSQHTARSCADEAENPDVLHRRMVAPYVGHVDGNVEKQLINLTRA